MQENRALGLSLVLVCGAILALAALVDFTTAGTPSICMFYRSTGLPCGGCGLTRACSAIAHGRWQQAWGYNPLGFVFMAAFSVGLMGGALTAWRPVLRRYVLPRVSFMLRGGVVLGVSLFLFGVWRIYDLVGWQGIMSRFLRPAGATPPSVILLHGDAGIRPPAATQPAPDNAPP